MIVTIPALWFAGIPTAPAAVEHMPATMLVLFGLLCAGVLLLVLSSRRTARRMPPYPRRVGRAVRGVPTARRADEGARHAGNGQTAAAIVATGVDGYRRFLTARDGAPDLGRHSLARRDVFFAALDATPVRSQRTIDAETFRRNLRRRHPERGLDQRLLWLLASAKANQAERFGVGISELYGRVPAPDEDPVRLHIHLQETYHTRVLAEVIEVFGLHVHPSPPPAMTRALINLMVFAPPRRILPLVGCSEMAGCVIFRALRDRGIALAADEPAVAERVRLLYDEILADEISHVGFIAAELGPWGRAVMRGLYRWLSPRLARQMPELLQLFGSAELKRRFRAFRLETLLTEYPNTAYAAALV